MSFLDLSILVLFSAVFVKALLEFNRHMEEDRNGVVFCSSEVDRNGIVAVRMVQSSGPSRRHTGNNSSSKSNINCRIYKPKSNNINNSCKAQSARTAGKPSNNVVLSGNVNKPQVNNSVKGNAASVRRAERCSALRLNTNKYSHSYRRLTATDGKAA